MSADSALKGIGFDYIDNLDVYQLREHSGYGADVVEIKLCNGTAQVFVTDHTRDWCIRYAVKAFQTLAKAEQLFN